MEGFKEPLLKKSQIPSPAFFKNQSVVFTEGRFFQLLKTGQETSPHSWKEKIRRLPNSRTLPAK